jgi:L-ascorbate metabolism protein UlaG (beta-lactamase superfamily)
VPVVRPDARAYATPPVSGLRMTWFGHASTLLEVDGSVVLIDPLWSERASPVSWAGPKRWYPPLLALADLPAVDAVLISHDHVDHLDMQSIVAMRDWSTVFVVPLGVGAHLERWGIPAARIVELDWWASTRVGPLTLVATPARHASGRLSSKSNKTLWAGWSIAGPQHKVWYSGDTGFHDDLASIGERLGPFDLTLIEAGQYDGHWPDNHLGPEQAVAAHRLVGGRVMVPVHWALIQQAPHAWTEPAERVLTAARCQGAQLLLPRPGEMVEPLTAQAPQPWWPSLPWRTATQSPVRATANGAPADRMAPPACNAG